MKRVGERARGGLARTRPRRTAGPQPPPTRSCPPSRRRRSRSACVVNGRLRQTDKSAVRRAPPCVVSRVGFYVLQDVTRVGECRAPNARCGVTGRMDSATISLNSFDIC